MAAKARSAVLFAIAALRKIVGLGLSLIAVSFLLLFFLQFNHSPHMNSAWLVVHLRQYSDPLLGKIASWVGASWPSESFTYFPVIAAGGLWAVNLAFGAVMQRGSRRIGKLMGKPEEAALAGVKAGSGERAVDSQAALDELLKRYREIEDALKTAKRKRCTFLSVDIVGSTEMKKGESPDAVATTFDAYEEFLSNIFKQFGAWKHAWTPDGVMMCFLQSDLAVAAAQRILLSLPKFNEERNHLQTPIRVRCGINEGEVPIYEGSDLAKVADRVIDVAGHMQKQGRPNTVWMSEEVHNLLGEKSGFRPINQPVDGYRVFEWSPEAATAPAETASN